MGAWLVRLRPYCHIMLNEGGDYANFTAIPKNKFYYAAFRVPFTKKWLRAHTEYRDVN